MKFVSKILNIIMLCLMIVIITLAQWGIWNGIASWEDNARIKLASSHKVGETNRYNPSYLDLYDLWGDTIKTKAENNRNYIQFGFSWNWWQKGMKWADTAIDTLVGVFGPIVAPAKNIMYIDDYLSRGYYTETEDEYPVSGKSYYTFDHKTQMYIEVEDPSFSALSGSSGFYEYIYDEENIKLDLNNVGENNFNKDYITKKEDYLLSDFISFKYNGIILLDDYIDDENAAKYFVKNSNDEYADTEYTSHIYGLDNLNIKNDYRKYQNLYILVYTNSTGKGMAIYRQHDDQLTLVSEFEKYDTNANEWLQSRKTRKALNVLINIDKYNSNRDVYEEWYKITCTETGVKSQMVFLYVMFYISIVVSIWFVYQNPIIINRTDTGTNEMKGGIVWRHKKREKKNKKNKDSGEAN